MTVFGGDAFGRSLGLDEVIGAEPPLGLAPLKEKEETSELPFSTVHGHSGTVAICKPGGESSPEPKHAGTLSSDFLPPEL